MAMHWLSIHWSPQTHHRASGETGITAYFDPALNIRAHTEVRECRLPHRNPWTGLSPLPPPDANALATARASIAPQLHATAPTATVAPQVHIPTPTATVAPTTINYIKATDEEAQAFDRKVAWSSGSLTPLEALPSPTPLLIPDSPDTALSLRIIKRRASAIANQHILHMNNAEDVGTYIVRAKAIDFIFHELYHLREALNHDDPASTTCEALGSNIDILLWHRTLLTSTEDLEMVKENLKTMRHLKKVAKTAPLEEKPLQ
ncbi:hypothetical protein QM012_005410 [Aureobasidium pullulans]|uniref:Uncharacterized protein n=1 Tax=Aureobasidium pullulans TaxID=5580 RepID=A0ABR0T614_AURPU